MTEWKTSGSVSFENAPDVMGQLGSFDDPWDFRIRFRSRWRRDFRFQADIYKVGQLMDEVHFTTRSKITREPWLEYLWRILAKEPLFKK